MTLCNMSIEGGARAGYVSPDETTYEYIKGRPYAPAGADWDRALAFWRGVASGADASFDDEVSFDAAGIEPMVTWGINPGQGISITESVPDPAKATAAARDRLMALLQGIAKSN